jgi:hypothetical protein
MPLGDLVPLGDLMPPGYLMPLGDLVPPLRHPLVVRVPF